TALACGQGATPYSNAAGSDRVASYYRCDPGTYDGNERVFTLQVATPQDVTLDLVNTDGRDRAMFLLAPGCDEWTGFLAGGATTLTRKFLLPGVTYDVVVDGRTAADDGPFTLAVACAEATTPVACGTTLRGERASGAGEYQDWSCNGGLAGPERIYT